MSAELRLKAVVLQKARNPVIGETVYVDIVVEDDEGNRVNLTSATMWLTLKTDPDSQADAAATLQLDSLHEASQFSTTTPATNGKATIELTGANTATFTAGTIYYLDVKVKDSNGKFYYPVPPQTIQFDQWVTRATSES